jgi:formamidopyrimidine-DNA glycosylase
MPELPEVEIIKRDLDRVITEKKISAVNLFSPKTARNKAAFFINYLLGRKFINISRRGKLLIFKISKLSKERKNSYLLIHLKMTGQLILESGNQKLIGGHSLSNKSFLEAVGGRLPNQYTRAQFIFSKNVNLFFNDLRKFGYLQIVTEEELSNILKNNYGPEPLTSEFSLTYLLNSFKNRKSNIKALLLNQKIVAGLGNIYVDEALFFAGINPNRSGESLNKSEIIKLKKSINKIITQSIENRGTTFNTYVDSFGKSGNFAKLLRVYGRQGLPCTNCKNSIKKIRLAGRGTHYCPYCQK